MQTWNKLLKYIKRKTGAPLNLLELTDNDIYEIIIEDVLPLLSEHIAKPMWIHLTSADLAETTSGESVRTYNIPIPEGTTLINVVDAYYTHSTNSMCGEIIGLTDPRDTVMMNEFLDMVASLDTVQTFQLIYPDKIAFSKELTGGVILKCNTVHANLSTIPSDIYYDIFRPWCVAEIKENIVNMRSKYETLTTPFGEIHLNWQKLEEDATRIREEIKTKLESLPTEHLITFV